MEPLKSARAIQPDINRLPRNKNEGFEKNKSEGLKKKKRKTTIGQQRDNISD
ncbi:hypothetical protein HMPREF6745_1382 [Prevotella sp. oral taxon 472 str. F0295]|nr:hypothetical protein HMPREF6745_1382 [Prevotella sp. oral taxon 472 str. F0295]